MFRQVRVYLFWVYVKLNDLLSVWGLEKKRSKRRRRMRGNVHFFLRFSLSRLTEVSFLLFLVVLSDRPSV